MAPRCQCDPHCPNQPLPGLPFCKVHEEFCPIQSPLSGSEPTYGSTKYNKNIEIQDTHNCFAYAMDYLDIPDQSKCSKTGCDVPFHQPGRQSGYPKWSKIKGKRCPDLIGRLKGDIPSIYRTTFTQKCRRGFNKIALVVDPLSDYHFYRQDKKRKIDKYSLWSHKPGGTRVTQLDASKHLIYNPELADRDYKEGPEPLHYKKFCSFFCAPIKTRKLKRGGGPTRRRRRP
jgi:hypothetical protein